MQRVSVVGPSGSGKTAVATRISALLGLPHLELDSVHWQPNWTPLATETLRARVDAFTDGDRWVVDGNYSSVRDLITSKADAVVWLRHSRAVVMRRLVTRSIRRVVSRRQLWNGNTERLSRFLAVRDPEHLIRWSWASFAKLAARYAAEMDDAELGHLTWVVLDTPADTERFLATLSPT
jgi:adenylate kinase family enzyme